MKHISEILQYCRKGLGPRVWFRCVLVVLLCLSVQAAALAQEMPVPVSVQVPLFTKILSFERNTRTKVTNELVVLILYQRNFRNSLNTKNAVEKQLDGKSLSEFSGASARVLTFALDSDSDLRQYLSRNRVNFIYVAPLRAYDIGNITSISRSKKILTGSGVVDYINEGISIGIDIRSEKPEIIINLAAAKHEGADLSSQLLKMARIIK